MKFKPKTLHDMTELIQNQHPFNNLGWNQVIQIHKYSSIVQPIKSENVRIE